MNGLRILEMTEPFPSKRSPLTALFVKSHIDYISKHCDLLLIVFVRLIPPKHLFKNLNKIKEWIKQTCRILRKKREGNILFIPYISLPRPYFEFLNIILLRYLYLKKVIKIAMQFKPDVLVVHWVSPLSFLARKVADRLGTLLVVDVHEDPDNIKINFPFLQKFWIKAIKSADAIVVHSEVNREKIKSLGINSQKIYKVYLGIDNIYINESTCLNDENNVENGEFRIVAVSHLSDPCKKIDYLLHAISELTRKYKNIKLVIIGDGKLRKSFEELSSVLNLKDYVDFKGALEPSGVKNELLKANLFVLPSVRESFGLVFIEAVALGLPVIGYEKAGAIFELDQLGVPVLKLENVTPQSIARAISLIYEDYPEIKRQILKHRETILNHFSWENHAIRYVDLLNKLKLRNVQESIS